MSVFPERDTNLCKLWESLSRYIMVFLMPSIYNFCVLWYKGLVSCRWPVGSAFGAAFQRFRGWRSILNGFWTLHSTWKSRFVSWALALHEWDVQYLGCFFIFSFSVWSTLWAFCQKRESLEQHAVEHQLSVDCAVRMLIASDLGLFQRGFIVVGFGG